MTFLQFWIFFLIDFTVTVLHSEDRNTPQKSLVRSQRLPFCINFDSIVFFFLSDIQNGTDSVHTLMLKMLENAIDKLTLLIF